MLPLSTLLILGSVGLFALGLVAGWMLMRNGVGENGSRLQLIVGIVVTVVWVVSITAEIIIPAYTASMLVHGIMGAVVGYLFSGEGLTLNIGKK